MTSPHGGTGHASWIIGLVLVMVIAALAGAAAIVVRSRRSAKRRQPHTEMQGVPPNPFGTPDAVVSTPSQPSARPRGVFISYRRGDERNFAGRLFERLLRSLESDQVFMDVDSIELGVDFKSVIDSWLARCGVMLVIIGKDWLNCLDPSGGRRLDDLDDFVRIEIESALARPGVRVIPILVDGAAMPSATDLPDSLKSLARRNALNMSHTGFGSDFERLFATLAKAV